MEGEADGIYGTGTVEAVNDAKTFLNDQYLKRTNAAQFQADPDDPDATPASAPQLPYTLNGEADAALLTALYDGTISQSYQTLVEGDKGSAVKRIQSRLTTLNYLYNGADGGFGADTKDAVSYFQKLNDLQQSGIADKTTQQVLFSQQAVPSDRPPHEYKVVVDISEQRVYVYAWHGNSYSKQVRKMKCSSGTTSNPTPLGDYSETVRTGERWHHFKDFGCWAQYAIHIDPTGNIMFHSVIYNRKGGSPTSGSVHMLGRRASHGCIRLATKDAKWMYEHITDGTNVVIKK